jgi:hypothetical protein
MLMLTTGSQIQARPTGTTFPTSGNDSDSSQPGGVPTSPPHPLSPLMTPGSSSIGSIGGLAAIAEKKRIAALGVGDDVELDELEDVEEGDEEGSASDAEGGARNVELERDMEGERMVRSGYLWKKQEKRKVSNYYFLRLIT